MKRTALIAAVIALVVGATALSVQHYDKYQKQEAQKRQVVEDAKAKEIASLKADRADLVVKYEAQRLNCEKGLASYGLLTAVVKAKTAQPVCGPVITR